MNDFFVHLFFLSFLYGHLYEMGLLAGSTWWHTKVLSEEEGKGHFLNKILTEEKEKQEEKR